MRLFLPILFLFFIACDDAVPVPKPRAYPRVVYPEKAYQPFESGSCPLTFDMPVYATVERDTLFFEKRPESDCWFNLAIPRLNAKIHCSYYPVTSPARFDELVQDAFTMTQKHNIKASYINEFVVSRPEDRVHGMIFEVEGPAASAYQFYLTDSTRHFLRGALYFNAQARPDSLAPVVKFVKEDLERMVATLKWK